MNVIVRLLEPTDERTGFRSGNADLDAFFHRFAGQNHFRHHYGATYAALLDATVAGYATVAAGSIGVELAAFTGRRPPGYPLPVLRLGRLAVDERYQGHGVGKHLLKHVLTVAGWMRDNVGCVGVLVDAKPDAVDFYARYGFVQAHAVEPHPVPATTAMFLPISAVPGRR